MASSRGFAEKYTSCPDRGLYEHATAKVLGKRQPDRGLSYPAQSILAPMRGDVCCHDSQCTPAGGPKGVWTVGVTVRKYEVGLFATFFFEIVSALSLGQVSRWPKVEGCRLVLGVNFVPIAIIVLLLRLAERRGM